MLVVIELKLAVFICGTVIPEVRKHWICLLKILGFLTIWDPVSINQKILNFKKEVISDWVPDSSVLLPKSKRILDKTGFRDDVAP